MEERLISSSMMMEDEQIEYSLRPKFLNEYICLLYTSHAGFEGPDGG